MSLKKAHPVNYWVRTLCVAYWIYWATYMVVVP